MMTPERNSLVPSNQHPAPSETGFTLIELLIVMSIILIIMAFIIPQVKQVTIKANQTSAIQTVKTVASAEFGYRDTYHTFGCPIAVLGGDPKSGLPSAQGAQIIEPNLASTGIKSGYKFAITCGDKTTVNNQDSFDSFELTGVPTTVGKTGDNGYCIDENNTVKYDPTGGTNCTQPLQ
jgi:type IV pilus assembly protein PilA